MSWDSLVEGFKYTFNTLGLFFFKLVHIILDAIQHVVHYIFGLF